jgi:hypothetical protein
VVKKIYKQKRAWQKLALSAACALALAASSGAAQAGTLNFESGFDSPVLTQGGAYSSGNFWVETYGVGASQAEDLVGVIVDGSDNGLCFSGGCPVNNPSNYYAGLNDGYLYFGLNNPLQRFQLRSLQASYIGAEGTSYPATPGALVIQGYNASGQALGSSLVLWLSGQTNGQFNFKNFDLSPLSANNYSFVRILGYGCNAQGNCSSGTGVSNFALDNIQIAEIPEPASFGLFGLGLAGLAALRRRRSI